MELEKYDMPDSIAIPFCYGTISFWQGKKQDQITHKWIAFVRGPDGQPIQNVIEKVVFILDDSFKDKERVITQAPFEIYEKGWGEFDMEIRIHFKKPFNKDPLSMVHYLALRPPNNQTPNTKRPVVSEKYEEAVFVNPSVEFYNNARDCVAKPVDSQANNENENGNNNNNNNNNEQDQQQKQEGKNDFHNHFTKFDPKEHRDKLDDALNIVKMEVDRLQDELGNKDKELQNLYKQINEYTVLKQ